MIKINGYWYNYDEVKEALEKKGYIVICEMDEADARGDKKVEWHAIKGDENVTVLNTLQSVALKEFQKKPPLI